jgi:hypothetical protein
MVEGIAGPYSIQQLRVVEGSTEPFIVVEEDLKKQWLWG